MTVTTEETYEVDGVDLNTLAWNLATLTGRQGIPAKRGDNDEIAYRQGRAWHAKSFDQRTETWAMWVLGCDDDGTMPTLHSQRAQFNANLEALKKLFGKRRGQLQLSKTVLFPDGLRTMTAQGECTNTLDPTVTAGGTRAVFTADIVMADPFWYGDQVTEVLTAGVNELAVLGTTTCTRLYVDLIGPLTGPIVITHDDLVIVLEYNASVASGRTVTLDVEEFTATDDLDTNVIGDVEHAGATMWMELDPDENNVSLSIGGGAGTVQIRYRPTYL